MHAYQVTLEGRNVAIAVEGSPRFAGFVRSCVVSAPNVSAAELAAIRVTQRDLLKRGLLSPEVRISVRATRVASPSHLAKLSTGFVFTYD
jgi:hypothetical protein